jgi:hypothetical protein
MFISFVYRDTESNKKILSTIFFERVQFLFRYIEDEPNNRTIITEVTMKVEYVDDGRFSRPSENKYIKLTFDDFNNIMRVLGVSLYGPFYNQLNLKYKTVVFATNAFNTDESKTIPGYTEPGHSSDAISDLTDQIDAVEGILEWKTVE